MIYISCVYFRMFSCSVLTSPIRAWATQSVSHTFSSICQQFRAQLRFKTLTHSWNRALSYSVTWKREKYVFFTHFGHRSLPRIVSAYLFSALSARRLTLSSTQFALIQENAHFMNRARIVALPMNEAPWQRSAQSKINGTSTALFACTIIKLCICAVCTIPF